MHHMQTLINIKHTTPGDATYHRSIFYVSSSTGSTAISKRADSDKRNDNTIKKLWSMLKGT